MIVTCNVEVEFVLVLNPMMSNFEGADEVGRFSTFEDAVSFYTSQLADTPYREEHIDLFNFGETKSYYFTFKAESPLKMFNPLQDIGSINEFGHGIHRVYTRVI